MHFHARLQIGVVRNSQSGMRSSTTPNTICHVDAFLIICNITLSPSAPSPAPTVPLKVVRQELMDAVGGMLDDPVYSDVAFIQPERLA